MSRSLILPLAVVVLALSGCSSTPDVASYLSPYRMDIRQGNFVSQEMVAQLRPGLTKDQVRFILGTPLVSDIFHGGDRWDYVYRFDPGRGETQQRRLMVVFEAGKLVRLGGDVAPTSGTPATEGGESKSAKRIIDIPAANAPEAAKAPVAADPGAAADPKPAPN